MGVGDGRKREDKGGKWRGEGRGKKLAMLRVLILPLYKNSLDFNA